jgi:hypothetical protein
LTGSSTIIYIALNAKISHAFTSLVDLNGVCCEKWNFMGLMDEAHDSFEQCVSADSHNSFGVSPAAIEYVYRHESKLVPLREVVVRDAVACYFCRPLENLDNWFKITRSKLEYDIEVAKEIKSHLLRDANSCGFGGCDAHRMPQGKGGMTGWGSAWP